MLKKCQENDNDFFERSRSQAYGRELQRQRCRKFQRNE
jgi:hypothetical protein